MRTTMPDTTFASLDASLRYPKVAYLSFSPFACYDVSNIFIWTSPHIFALREKNYLFIREFIFNLKIRKEWKEIWKLRKLFKFILKLWSSNFHSRNYLYVFEWCFILKLLLYIHPWWEENLFFSFILKLWCYNIQTKNYFICLSVVEDMNVYVLELWSHISYTRNYCAYPSGVKSYESYTLHLWSCIFIPEIVLHTWMVLETR